MPTAAELARRRATIRAAVDATDQFVLPTEALACEVRGRLVPEERSVVLPYCIDPAPYATVSLEREPHDAAFRFGFAGQFAPHKGLHVLLEAARLLDRRADLPPWNLRLHGASPAGRSRRYLAAARPLAPPARVEWAGAYPALDAARHLAALDALVVPSLWTENAPLAVLQARALGLPLVAADVAGVREVAPPGPYVHLSRAGDAADLAKALAAVLVEGRRRNPDVRPPLAYGEHLARIEALYAIHSGRLVPRPPAGRALPALPDTARRPAAAREARPSSEAGPVPI